jgi:TRAP-type C4-dicarboxylate transport system permease small subunit
MRQERVLIVFLRACFMLKECIVDFPAKTVARIGDAMRVAGCLCLLAMAMLTVADITGRLNQSPIFGSEEVVSFLAVLALGLGLPYTHAHRSHIGVEVFVQLLSTRTRRRLKVFRELLSVLFFALVTVMLGLFARDKQLSGEVSMTLGLPEHLLIYVLSGCFALTTLAMLVDLLQFLREWRQS